MSNKKFLSLAAASALLLSLCGCTNAPSQQNPTTAASNASSGTTIPADTTVTEASTTEKVVPPMDTSPVTFSLYVDDPEYSLAFDTPAAKEITALTGVTLEIIVPDDETGLDTLIASGEMPDLIYAGERTDELIDGGTVISLDEYIEDFGENFSELYGSSLDGLRHEDGKIYTFGTGGASSADFWAEGSFQIKYDVLEELEYPEITTLEQLGDCLKQYMESHPGTSGLLLCGAPQQQWTDTVSKRVNYVLGYPDDGDFLVDNETGEAVYKWTDPRTGELVKWLNQMYNDGVLDENSFSLKHTPYLEKISSGKVLAIADYLPDIDNGDDYCPLPVTLNNDTKSVFLADYGFSPADGIAITSDCDEPERAFRFLDWWCSEEAQELINFGNETINEEFATDSESYTADTGVGMFTEPFPMKKLSEKNTDGEFYYSAAEEYISEYSADEAAAAEAYGIDFLSELFPQRDALPAVKRTLVSEMEIPALSETAILLEGLETYVKTEIPNAITVPTEEFDAKWAEITEWCSNNGADRLGELMTETIKADMGI